MLYTCNPHSFHFNLVERLNNFHAVNLNIEPLSKCGSHCVCSIPTISSSKYFQNNEARTMDADLSTPILARSLQCLYWYLLQLHKLAHSHLWWTGSYVYVGRIHILKYVSIWEFYSSKFYLFRVVCSL